MNDKPLMPPPEEQVRPGPRNQVVFNEDAEQWHFIAKAKGLEIPDPRWKPPERPELAIRSVREMVQFHFGNFSTNDKGLAKALYDDYNLTLRNGRTPLYAPSSVAVTVGRPKQVTGAASVTNTGTGTGGEGDSNKEPPAKEPDGKAPAPPSKK